jgi:hypothetical protein
LLLGIGHRIKRDALQTWDGFEWIAAHLSGV